jgi:hypothetical protein
VIWDSRSLPALGEREARACAVITQQLAGRDFKMALERLATLHISSSQTDHQRLGRYGARRLWRLGSVA